MEKYLITQSLLSSYAYQFDCAEGCEEDAREEFLSALRREEKEQSEAMLNGCLFENAVYSLCAGNKNYLGEAPVAWDEGIRAVATAVKGAQFQVKLKREIEVDGMTFLVYGILDALQAGVISDVKFKNKSFNSIDIYGNWNDSPQHPAYFYLCPEAYKFQYLVSDGESLYVEEYRPEDSRYIGDLIHEFIEGIKASGDFETYKQNWVAL